MFVVTNDINKLTKLGGNSSLNNQGTSPNRTTPPSTRGKRNTKISMGSKAFDSSGDDSPDRSEPVVYIYIHIYFCLHLDNFLYIHTF